MAAKRMFCETESCPDQLPEKRTKPRPSFASIIGEVVMVNSLRHLSKALEPLLRRVVNEEVERCLMRYSRTITRSTSLRIQALEPSSYQLVFSNKLTLPIFTGSKITDIDGHPLQLLLVDASGNPAVGISQTIKVELVVLDGDFSSGDRENWSPEEFNANVVKERSGRRPLLHGEMNVTLRHGAAAIGDIEFTDNSSWIRSRKFRLGARLVSGTNRDQGRRIREAITEAFVVRDHRGELYKKHYPPMLHDKVWRLEKIGKEGVFHKKLSNENIKTVQDFLKLSIIDPPKLRRILGVGMSDRMWESTIKHARTCELGNKMYVYRGLDSILFLNPICEVVKAIIGDQVLYSRDLNGISKAFIENLKRQAYDNWDGLLELEGNPSETLLLTQGNGRDMAYGNEEMLRIGGQIEEEYVVEKSCNIQGYEFITGQSQVECSEWDSHSDQFNISPTIQDNSHYNF